MRNFGVYIFLFFVSAFIYLFEYAITINLTFNIHIARKELKKLEEKIEELRVKEVILSSNERFYSNK